MKNVNTFVALFFTSVLLFCVSCGTNKAYVSVSLVSETWLDAKIAIQADLQNTEEHSAQKIDAFIEALNRFFASPVGALYQVQQLEEMRQLENIVAMTERLKVALQNGKNTEVFSLILEIDRSINFLQYIDTQISNTSQWNYFYLFFFFAILIMIIIATMSFLYQKLEKTEELERRSITFSRETVRAQEEERSRIAKELHDTVSQDLWRLSFQIDNIGKSKNTEERSRLCTEVVNSQREVMKQVRSICDNLIPPDFSRRGFINAIRLFCYNFEQRTKIVCSFFCEENLQLCGLENSVQLQCFRIAQECLANIEKHSGAANASVFIKMKNDDTLVISISDNGKGFLPPDRKSSQQFKDEGHIGLWSLFERAVLLEGKLNIESAPNRGTNVTLEIPVLHHK